MKFIVFEGVDGAGKSTLIGALTEHLKNHGISFILTREPGGTPLGEEIRDLLLKKSEEPPTPRAELLLYQAARAQHVECLIRPSLGLKKWVICDRFTASSVAFQSGGRGVPAAEIKNLNDYATAGLKPDLNVLLDLSVEEAQKRMEGRELDRFESEDQGFHNRVRSCYLNLVKEEAAAWLVLDASLPAPQLAQLLLNELNKRGWVS